MGFDGSEDRSSDIPEQSNPERVQTPEAAAASDDLAKVQELLFGRHIREQRDELARLEAHIVQRTNCLRGHMVESAGALENLLVDAKRELHERCNAESGERKAVGEAFAKSLRDFEHSIDARFAALEERSIRAERELRDQFASQCRLLRDAMARTHETAMKFAREGLEELKATRIDRSVLSSVLLQLAKGVDGETAAAPPEAPAPPKS